VTIVLPTAIVEPLLPPKEIPRGRLVPDVPYSIFENCHRPKWFLSALLMAASAIGYVSLSDISLSASAKVAEGFSPPSAPSPQDDVTLVSLRALVAACDATIHSKQLGDVMRLRTAIRTAQSNVQATYSRRVDVKSAVACATIAATLLTSGI
jgi:hypothetical protein